MEKEIIKSNWNEVLQKAKNAAFESDRNFDDIKIIAVSKTKPAETLLAAIEAGLPYLGENYVQELKEKYSKLSDMEIELPEFHFIGHLQRNKVKYLAPFITMIHTVDSVKLAKEISKQAQKNDRTIDILLQVNTSGEESKSGCSPDDIFNLVEGCKEIPDIKINGLMTIGTFSDDELIIRREFSLLRKLRDACAEKYPAIDFKELSMGMTHDYTIAIDEGATMVRVGTAIFGARIYK